MGVILLFDCETDENDEGKHAIVVLHREQLDRLLGYAGMLDFTRGRGRAPQVHGIEIWNTIDIAWRRGSIAAHEETEEVGIDMLDEAQCDAARRDAATRHPAEDCDQVEPGVHRSRLLEPPAERHTDDEAMRAELEMVFVSDHGIRWTCYEKNGDSEVRTPYVSFKTLRQLRTELHTESAGELQARKQAPRRRSRKSRRAAR